VVLAAIATIIASQSIITGAFSMTRRAIQLGGLAPDCLVAFRISQRGAKSQDESTFASLA
jgi:K+ transporter